MKLAEIHLLLGEQRKSQNLSQKDIAESLNVEQASVSLYENGKRGIPLDLLDHWLQLLEVEVKITPKGCEPVKPAEEIESDLEKAHELRKRRNYLIAEMRTMMAERIAQVPEFQRIAEDSGESVFWRYSFCGDPTVGLVETRYDHPKQKYLAVEYTQEGVNVYKFLGSDGADGWEPPGASRIYFSEDDFLTLGGRWEPENMEMRRIPVLRERRKQPDGYELVCAEGFSLSSLLEIQQNHKCLAAVYKQMEGEWEYVKMSRELNDVESRFHDVLQRNRLRNGMVNSNFPVWTEADMTAIDVPLWAERRNWTWKEEGVTWVEEHQEMEEIRLSNEESRHEEFYVHRDEDGNRVIGLIGAEHRPAVFKSNLNKPGVIYRVAVDLEELSEKEKSDYAAIRKATEELEEMRKSIGTDEIRNTGLEPIEKSLAEKRSME